MNRRARGASASAVVIVIVLAVLVAANVLASKSADAWDLTRVGYNTLAPQSVLAAKRVDSDLLVLGLFRPGANNGQQATEALIGLYEAQSPHVKYRAANPDTDPADVKRYGITEINTVVLEYRGKTELLLQGSQSEQSFTSALLKLESDRVPVVCWAVGDGERDLKDTNPSTGYSSVADLLAKNKFAWHDVLLTQVSGVPADCDELAILDPTKALPDKTSAMVDAYLAGGGHLLVVADPWAQDPLATTSLNVVLKPYGVGFSGALVVETDPSHAATQDPTNPAVTSYGRSPITNDIQGVVSFFPHTTAITGAPAPGVQAVHLASTTAGAFAAARIRSDLTRPAGDTSGPFTMMETLEQSAGAGSTRIVIVGTPAFAENRTLPPNNADADVDLALGSIQWLAGQDSLIALPPKPERAPPLALTQSDQSLLIFLTAVVMPGVMIVGGIAVWWRRRVFS